MTNKYKIICVICVIILVALVAALMFFVNKSVIEAVLDSNLPDWLKIMLIKR